MIVWGYFDMKLVSFSRLPFLKFLVSSIFYLYFGRDAVFAVGDGDKWVHFQKCTEGESPVSIATITFFSSAFYQYFWGYPLLVLQQ